MLPSDVVISFGRQRLIRAQWRNDERTWFLDDRAFAALNKTCTTHLYNCTIKDNLLRFGCTKLELHHENKIQLAKTD